MISYHYMVQKYDAWTDGKRLRADWAKLDMWASTHVYKIEIESYLCMRFFDPLLFSFVLHPSILSSITHALVCPSSTFFLL